MQRFGKGAVQTADGVTAEPDVPAAAPRDGVLDLGGLWRGIVAHRNWIIVPTLLLLAATFVFVNAVKPRYTAETKIFLENQDNYYTRPGADRTADAAIDAEAVQSQVQLVLSRDLARQAIAELGLAGNKEFDPLAGGMSAWQRVMVLLGLQRDPTTLSPEERIFETYFDRLAVFQVPRTRVVTVEFTSYDPALAAKAANTIAALYINLRANAKTETARQAGEWLSTTIDDLRTKVAEAEARVETFRAQNGLLAGSNNMTIPGQQLADLNTQLANARSAQSEAQAKARVIREMLRAGRGSEIPEVARDDLIRRIEEQRVTLRGQLALESRTLLPGHPRIKELNAQIADIDRELRLAADKTARSLENEARLAGARVDNLTATLDLQKKTVATGNSDEVQLRALEREAKVARDQLESYLARYREAVARDSGNASPADARIVSRAVEPQLPSFPKKIPMLLIAGLVGLLLSSSVVVTRELFVGYQTGAASVPYSASDTIDMADTIPVFGKDDPLPEPDARTARAAAITQSGLSGLIAAMHHGERAARVAIASPSRQDGVTAAAVVLARKLSTQGRTILVDLDLAMPSLDELVMPPATEEEEEAPFGISDLLAGTATFADAIHRDRASRLHVMPAGHETKLGPGLDDVLDALSATYDFVVLDCPPALDSSTVFNLAPNAEAVILVGAADDESVLAARAELAEAGATRVIVYDAEADGEVRAAA